MNIRENIMNSILSIHDKKTKTEIPILKKELVFEKSMYSSTNEKIWHIVINDNRLRKNTDVIITYCCGNCNTISQVGTTQFLRRIREEKTHCHSCANFYRPEIPVKKIADPIFEGKKDKVDFHQKSLEEFEKCNDVYKASYLLSHLTEEDFERIRSKIISFGNGKYTDFDNYEFWSIYRVANQMRYSSVIYDKKNDCIFKMDQPIVKCDNCLKPWRAKTLEGFKNDYKILCKDCKLCNRTFKLRPIENISSETIMYQSKLEKKFVEWCNEKGLLVRNGPSIPYVFEEKSRVYRVDFQIADVIIEIKDFHIWHRNQIESGLWQTKIDAVNNYISEHANIEKYFFITPGNWNQMIKELVGYLGKDKDKEEKKREIVLESV